MTGVKAIETLRLASLKNFLCNKIKIMNLEMFELYYLLKESKMLHKYTL